VIGSTFSDWVKTNGSEAPNQGAISWTQVRKGAIGLVLPTGSELKLTRLRMRLLR